MRAVVFGAGGFIGSHLVRRLKADGHWVRGVDIRPPRFVRSSADEFLVLDLRDRRSCDAALAGGCDELYQLAADMGGAGYIFTGNHDADIMRNSAAINLNVVDVCITHGVGTVFYASSACVYPRENQLDPASARCAESSAYPANPDSEYGWEKLFSERLYLAAARNHGLNVRIGRYHNVYGPEGAWNDGREKAPAALCRKIAAAADGGEVEIWGDGNQLRTFLFIDDGIDGTLALTRSGVREPVNIGSEELVSINQMADLIATIAGKRVQLRHVDGPQGVRCRSSDNRLVRALLGWEPRVPLRTGLECTYGWIAARVADLTVAA